MTTQRPLDNTKGLDFLSTNPSGESVIMADQPPCRVAHISSPAVFYRG